MVEFNFFQLENGLRVVHSEDRTTPLVAVNLLYNVGAKFEIENKTGFAHLFEHLMFGGTEKAPSFDEPLQLAGGESNAFTSNDLTNYYVTIPTENIETALWLEADRMENLLLSERALEVQRKVVIEEFKQRYLNQPYGDVFLLLRPLAYKKHPYRWPTIGKEIRHIEDANLDDVADFFNRFYGPNNAILSLVGDLHLEQAKLLVNKWFGALSPREISGAVCGKEEAQESARFLSVERDVPNDALYMAFHMVERKHPDFYIYDLISNILAKGSSSRLYRLLVKGSKHCNDISAYITSDIDPGLFIISSNLKNGASLEEVEALIEKQLYQLSQQLVEQDELKKVINNVVSTIEFSKVSALNKAMILGYSQLIDEPNLINTESDHYKSVDAEGIMRVSKKLFAETNKSTLHYKSKGA